MNGLTASKEHYLKIIYELASHDGSARITDIAAEMEVSKASVCKAVDELVDKGFVYRREKLVCLTDVGSFAAEGIVRNFTTVRDYLMQSVGLDSKTAVSVACALEHVLDYRNVNQLAVTSA